jgi:hypothetical protein
VRAGYDHEACIEERPRISHGSLVLSSHKGATSNYSHLFISDIDCNSSISGMATSRTFPGTGYHPGESIITGPGYGLSAAASIFGASISSGLQHLMSSTMSISGVSPNSLSDRSPFRGDGYSKRYSETVRSSASSFLNLGRNSRQDPPVAVMPHPNSPYENLFFGQSGKTMRLLTSWRRGSVVNFSAIDGTRCPELSGQRDEAWNHLYINPGRKGIDALSCSNCLCMSTSEPFAFGFCIVLLNPAYTHTRLCLGDRNLSMSRSPTVSDYQICSRSFDPYTRKRTTSSPCFTWL